MRKTAIVLLAVLALATTAYGDVFATWTGGTGDWFTPSNWNVGKVPSFPATAPDPDSATINTAGANITIGATVSVNSFSFMRGNILLTGGDFWGRRGCSVGYQQYTYGDAKFIQSGGTNTGSINVGGDSRGNGIYTISGGLIGNINNHGAAIRLGPRPNLTGENNTGEFVIDESGTTTPTSIIVSTYAQVNSTKATSPPAPSKSKVILSVVGYVTPIEVTGADYSYGGTVPMSAADLEGVLSVDDSNYTNVGNEVITVDIIKVTGTGTLDYAGLALDAASSANGWTLGDDGAGTLQVSNIPEPATMVLLGIGGIGVLIRRRRK